MTNSNDEWSSEELHGAVKAYLWMLEQETEGRPYNKTDVNRSLRNGVLHEPSKSSIEYRMQNISAVLEELCLPRIKGYLPGKNLGPSVRAKIRHLLTEEKIFNPNEYELSSDELQLNSHSA